MNKFSTVLLMLVVFAAVGVTQEFNQSISGTVTLDEDGSAVTLFVLQIVDTSLPFPIPWVATTDENGNYNRALPTGTYTISPVDDSFYEPFEITGVVVNAGQNVVRDIVVTKRPPDAIISGTVILEDLPVEGAEVMLYRIVGLKSSFAKTNANFVGAAYTAVTEKDGKFSIDVVHGSYLLYIPPDGNWMPYWSSDIYVGVGENTKLNIELEKQPLKKISGTVFNHQIFEYVIFNVTNLDTNFRSQSFLMNESGEYSVNAFPGRTLLSAAGFSNGAILNLYYGDVTSEDQATILNIVNDTTGIDFTFPTNLTLSDVTVEGKVTDESTGLPIEMAKVRFKSEDVGFTMNENLHYMPYTYTDANGEYSITGTTFLQNVTLYSSASKEGYFTEFYDNQSTFFTATPINVSAGGTAKNIDFSLTPTPTTNTYSISGTVLGEDGLAPDYGSVIAYSNVGTKYVETNTDGSYLLEGFPEGTELILQAWGFPGYLPVFYENAFSWHDAKLITMDGNKTINFTLPPINHQYTAGAVGGKVTQPNGKSDGVTLYIKKVNSDSWYASDYTDVNGNFNLPIESYGTYELLATGQGYQDYQMEILVDESTGLYVSNLELNMSPTSIAGDQDQIVREHILYAAYPNPFNPRTTIEIGMAKRETAELYIFNILGQKIKVLHHGILDQGSHKFSWDGSDNLGRNVASGLYFYQLKTESSVRTRSVLLMK